MRKTNRIVVSIFLVIISFHSFSQGSLRFNLGASIPLSHYGSSNINDEYRGSTGLGFGLGLQYIYPLTKNGLGVFGGIETYYNGVKKSVKNDIEDFLNALGISNQDVSIKWVKSIIFPISLGLNYNHTLQNNIAFFSNGGLTLNILKLTDQVVTSPNDKSRIKTNLASSLGVKIGFGMEFKEKINFSINYLGLNKYDLHKKAYYSGTFENFDSKLKVDIVTICLGYRF